MADLMALAFQTDTTRVATFAAGSDEARFPGVVTAGYERHCHTLEHQGNAGHRFPRLALLTSKAADTALGTHRQPVPLTPLGHLEMRNACNLAVKCRRIPEVERAALLAGRGGGHCQRLSDADDRARRRLARPGAGIERPLLATVGTRGLDLLHIAPPPRLDGVSRRDGQYC